MGQVVPAVVLHDPPQALSRRRRKLRFHLVHPRQFPAHIRDGLREIGGMSAAHRLPEIVKAVAHQLVADRVLLSPTLEQPLPADELETLEIGQKEVVMLRCAERVANAAVALDIVVADLLHMGDPPASGDPFVDDAVILASFVQEEAGNAEDPNVAQVFLNRLAEGSPYPRLESNASSYVQNPKDNNYLYNWVAPYYGGWENIPQDLYEAYNTYECVGLPAGPISNPGIDAIRAVAEPNTDLVSEKGNSPCYFFVTDLTGKYYYGATAAEHAENVEQAWKVNASL